MCVAFINKHNYIIIISSLAIINSIYKKEEISYENRELFMNNVHFKKSEKEEEEINNIMT